MIESTGPPAAEDNFAFLAPPGYIGGCPKPPFLIVSLYDVMSNEVSLT